MIFPENNVKISSEILNFKNIESRDFFEICLIVKKYTEMWFVIKLKIKVVIIFIKFKIYDQNVTKDNWICLIQKSGHKNKS